MDRSDSGAEVASLSGLSGSFRIGRYDIASDYVKAFPAEIDEGTSDFTGCAEGKERCV